MFEKTLKIDDTILTYHYIEPKYLITKFPSEFYSLSKEEQDIIEWNFLLENVEKIEKEFNIKIHTNKYGYYLTR